SAWITIPNWVITIIYFIAFVGTWGYIITITGNMLDASKEDVEGWEKGIKRTGLRHYLCHGIIYTLLPPVAELLNQIAIKPTNFKVIFLIIGIALGVTNLYVSRKRVQILAQAVEVPLIPRYQIAFGVLGIINLGMVVVSYLVR
ncbi:MAG: hypothetical protein AB1801_18525, partial [Chloroflexota bacterium]